MSQKPSSLTNQAQILHAKVSKHALIGLGISITAIVFATLLVCYFIFGQINLQTIITAHKSNIALWVMDFSPLVYLFLGQRFNSTLKTLTKKVIEDTEAIASQNFNKQPGKNLLFDNLTKLPTCASFFDDAVDAISEAQDKKHLLAILLIDIEQFKTINDTMGHRSGDTILKTISDRLCAIVSSPNIVARMGGDEFAILLPKIAMHEEATRIAQSIHTSFQKPFTIGDLTLNVFISIGIALFPEHGIDADTLVQHADAALYVAKQEGKTYTLYSDEHTRQAAKKHQLTGDLRFAISNDELILEYQPKVEINSNFIYSVEALIRWDHQQHGTISPDQFIPLAEKSSLIKSITYWVIKEALRQYEEWKKDGTHIQIAVNITNYDLLDENFPDAIKRLLKAFHVEPGYLMLEITENAFMTDHKTALNNITSLHQMGVKIAIDDFGTGFSSLSYLGNLPVDELKIDKSFIMNMQYNTNNEVIVKAMIDLAHNLNLIVVAEGVENATTLKHLAALQCDVIQGYFVSRELSADEFAFWLANEKYLAKHTVTESDLSSSLHSA